MVVSYHSTQVLMLLSRRIPVSDIKAITSLLSSAISKQVLCIWNDLMFGYWLTFILCLSWQIDIQKHYGNLAHAPEY